MDITYSSCTSNLHLGIEPPTRAFGKFSQTFHTHLDGWKYIYIFSEICDSVWHWDKCRIHRWNWQIWSGKDWYVCIYSWPIISICPAECGSHHRDDLCRLSSVWSGQTCRTHRVLPEVLSLLGRSACLVSDWAVDWAAGRTWVMGLVRPGGGRLGSHRRVLDNSLWHCDKNSLSHWPHCTLYSPLLRWPKRTSLRSWRISLLRSYFSSLIGISLLCKINPSGEEKYG